MTREEREIRTQVAALKNEARHLVGEDKLTEAKAKAKEAEQLAEKADLLAQLEADDLNNVKEPKGEKKDKDELKATYNKAFFKAFRRQRLTPDEIDAVNALTSSEDADGGLLVPEDVLTAINFYKRTLSQLEPLINKVSVATDAGSRVFEKIAVMAPLANITDDTADIAEMTSPQFEALTYAIKKYAGWLPVPNDLLKDSDQNIMAYLAQWIARKSVVTRNALILAVLKAGSATALADYKAIKKALNVTLDPMIAANAVIVTNQDGFQYLDSLEDGTGKPILQVDVTAPAKKLFAGKRVEVVANSVLTTSGTSTKKAPMFIGDLNEAVVMFERQGYQVDSTNVGGTAFRKDRTEIRVIEREDIKARDTDAFVYGEIDVTSVL
jgi:HK97 family phage major capsid protein